MFYRAIHLRLEAWGCAPSLLLDTETLVALLRHVVVEVGMMPVGEPMVYVSHDSALAWGRGVTVIQILSDSSAVLHTLADLGHTYVDLFTCAPLGDPAALARDLAGALRATGYRWRVEDRTIGAWRPSLADLLRRTWRALTNL